MDDAHSIAGLLPALHLMEYKRERRFAALLAS